MTPGVKTLYNFLQNFKKLVFTHKEVEANKQTDARAEHAVKPEAQPLQDEISDNTVSVLKIFGISNE